VVPIEDKPEPKNFTKNDLKNPIQLKGKLREKSNVYNEENKKTKKFGFNFEKIEKFNQDFNSMTDLMESLNFIFGQTITDSKLDISHKVNDSQVVVYQTGQRLEAYILRYYKRFQELKNSIEKYIYDMEEAIRAVDCDVRDLMYFYYLLPRFRFIFSKMSNETYKGDPIIMYYRDKVTEILFKWQTYNKDFFKYYSFFLFWFSFLEGIFEMPFGLNRNKQFKYTMIERTVESWMDATTLSQKFRSDSDTLISGYKDIFEELKLVFEGVEDYSSIKIPFDIVDIQASVREVALGVFALCFVMLWNK
jgi:hypothetical protein